MERLQHSHNGLFLSTNDTELAEYDGSHLHSHARETDAAVLRAKDQPGLHNNFQANLCYYIQSHFKNQNKNEKTLRKLMWRGQLTCPRKSLWSQGQGHWFLREKEGQHEAPLCGRVWCIFVIVLSKSKKRIASSMNPEVNYRFWVITVFQCSWSILKMCRLGQQRPHVTGNWGKYFPLNFVVKSKSP